MNINSTNWKLIDFVYRYAEDDKSANSSSYKKLQKLIELYPTFPVSVFGCALRGVPLDGKTLKDNKFYITDEMYENAIPQLEYLADVLNSINVRIPNHGGAKSYLQCAIIFCYNLPKVDQSRLKVSIVNNIGSPAAVWMDICTAITFIQNCYNKGLSATKKIYMDTEYKKSIDLRRSESVKLGIKRKKEIADRNEVLDKE